MADDPKPVACGACGHGKTFLRDVDIPGHQDHDGGVHDVSAWQVVCEGCEAAASLCESEAAAVAAWNAMWAGRAGEARSPERVGGDAELAAMYLWLIIGRFDDDAKVFVRGEAEYPNCCVKAGVLKALASLGLSPRAAPA